MITVRSASSDTTSTVGGEVVIRGDAIFRIGLLPQRRTSRGRGRFTVRVSNTGLAPARIAFEARDTEDACQFRFRDDQSPLIEAGEAFDLPL